MPLTIYSIIFVCLIVIGIAYMINYLYSRPISPNHSNIRKKHKSSFNYTLYARKKNSNLFSLAYENNNLGAIGYEIYTNYLKSLNETDIYICDNKKDTLLKIIKNTYSESMIGVDHPEYGHIGYLPFVNIKNNK